MVTRTDKAMRNMMFNAGGQIIALAANFIVRTVFLKTLSADYFGVSGLFSNILTILSLAELGIGNAIIFSMYYPLANKNEEKVASLLGFYRVVYFIIGLVVAFLGCLLIPFLPELVGSREIENLTVIYLMYLLNTVVSYFFSYKRSLLIADQKSYICMLFQNSFFTIQNLIQAVFLWFTHNFIIYLVIQLITTILINISISKRVDYLYPNYVGYKSRKPLDSQSRKEIIENIKAIFLQRIGDAVVSNTDNILISLFVGIRVVGYYSNYILIVTAVMLVINEFFNGCTASIGNLNVDEGGERVYDVYRLLLFIEFWICGFVMTGLFYVFNPFISFWVGESYTLEMSNVLLICIVFYFNQTRRIHIIMKEAMGVFKEDRVRPVLHAGANLMLSIWLGREFGLNGILAGTILSMLLTTFWMEPKILYQHGFHRSVKPFFLQFFLNGILLFAVVYATGYLAKFITFSGFAEVILKMLLCCIVPNLFYLLCFWNRKEFKSLLAIIERKWLSKN